LVCKKWSHYPERDYAQLENKVAHNLHLNKGEVVLAPGAASIISALLNYFAINGFEINIVQPSYAFFNYHCTSLPRLLIEESSWA
jgi:histidinol-phosphate/aromatic aminotransferase/cobyric acid decarboxylase-like protein